MKIINLIVASLLFVSNVHAQSIVNDLVGVGIEGNQATVLNESFNSKVPASIVPNVDVTANLGSATKNFKNFYLGQLLDLSFEVLAGAGTTVADAAALSATKIVHQITGANGTLGWKFPVTTNVGTVHVLLNTTAGVAKIYAASGGTVNGAAADAAFSALTGIKPIICISTATDTWICS